MRIVAGHYRSRKLVSLRGQVLRPTSDRLRETLFNILGSAVDGAVFMDVYAGTGAVGIEALSRGARQVVFIENHPAAVKLIRRNLDSLGLGTGSVRAITDPAEILAMDAVRGLERFAARNRHADYVFLDPPYAEWQEYQRVLEFLDGATMLAPNGRVIIEHLKRIILPQRLRQLEKTRVVEQGDATLSFYRLARAA